MRMTMTTIQPKTKQPQTKQSRQVEIDKKRTTRAEYQVCMPHHTKKRMLRVSVLMRLLTKITYGSHYLSRTLSSKEPGPGPRQGSYPRSDINVIYKLGAATASNTKMRWPE